MLTVVFVHFNISRSQMTTFDNSGEIAAAVKSMGWRHVLSQPYVSQSSGVIEREIRTILEGARANLFQSGLPVELWPLAALLSMLQFQMARTSRRGLCVLGMSFLQNCRIGSIVSASIGSSPSFCQLRMSAFLLAITCNLALPTRMKFWYCRSRICRTSCGRVVFPAKQAIADDKPCSPDELEYEPESHLQPGEAAVPEEVLMEDPPAPAEGLADHDPDHMPDGSAVPPGFQWDGLCLVRARKSSRPQICGNLPLPKNVLVSLRSIARSSRRNRRQIQMLQT